MGQERRNMTSTEMLYYIQLLCVSHCVTQSLVKILNYLYDICYVRRQNSGMCELYEFNMFVIAHKWVFGNEGIVSNGDIKENQIAC